MGRPLRLHEARKMKRWDPYQITKTWEHFEKCGRFVDWKHRLGPFEGIKDEWKNNPAFVIGGSSSARGFDLNLLNGLNTITCNHMIEYYDKSKWFLFMDHRFLRITKYDLSKYKGKIFVHNSAPVHPEQFRDQVYFKTRTVSQGPTSKIEDGLYSRSLSGMCITHLAILSGASKIYLLGLDHPKDRDISNGLHYREDYTGEGDKIKSNKGVTNLLKYFDKFKPWADRIVNVCDNPHFDWCESISLKEFEKVVK